MSRYPLYRRPVWKGAENFAPAGIQSLDHPASSESLYRLRCPRLLFGKDTQDEKTEACKLDGSKLSPNCICLYFLLNWNFLIYLRWIQINISVTKKIKADYFGEDLLPFGSESSVWKRKRYNKLDNNHTSVCLVSNWNRVSCMNRRT